MAKCKIAGVFKNDSKDALQKAKEFGIYGACSFSGHEGKDSWDYIPDKDGHITFELVGKAPFAELHKIAKLVCELSDGYEVSITETEKGV